jgi:hypothetical protein
MRLEDDFEKLGILGRILLGLLVVGLLLKIILLFKP